MSKKTDKTEMDPNVREEAIGSVPVNSTRVCWALKTLVKEFMELFPETPVEYSNYDGRNTAHDVMFDLTVLDDADRDTLVALFGLFDFDADPRIDMVIAGGEEHEGQVLVSFHSNPRTQDDKSPFGLSDAWLTLTEDADEEDPFLPIHDMLTSHSLSEEAGESR